MSTESRHASNGPARPQHDDTAVPADAGAGSAVLAYDLPDTVEARAVLTAARWDPQDPGFHVALEVAMARRGGRDALLAITAREGSWLAAALALVGQRSSDPGVGDNIAAMRAIAYWALDCPETALAALPARHGLGDMVRNHVRRPGIREQWLTVVARIDPAHCLAFRG